MVRDPLIARLRERDVEEHLRVVSVPTARADDHAILGHLLRGDALDGSAVVRGGVHLANHGSDGLAVESPAWGCRESLAGQRTRPHGAHEPRLGQSPRW